MKHFTVILFVFIAVTTTGVLPVSAQIVTGASGGAFYKFAVPINWNHDLVIWNEGLDLRPIAPFTVDPAAPLADLGDLASLQFSEGFALAVTSRRDVGWAVFKSNNDLRDMMDAFASQFGTPDRIFVTGGSFGGLVAIDAIESGHLGNVVGGLSLCGTIAGSRNWNLALDLRLTYDAVCSGVPGAAIPGGATGLPQGLPFNVPAAVNECTGILLPPLLRSAEQKARLAKILSVTQIPENFLLTDMLYSTFVMSDLVYEKLSGKIATENLTVDYGDLQINTSIARVVANAGARQRLEDNYTPAGTVGNTRIVSLHTDKDGLSLVENESDYASKVPAANFTSAIAVEAVPSHCGFTPAEAIGAWESLRGWVASGLRPNAGNIQATCELLAPSVGGPCRIDPNFVVPNIDGRIRPR